jgi:hypothetical protein
MSTVMIIILLVLGIRVVFFFAFGCAREVDFPDHANSSWAGMHDRPAAGFVRTLGCSRLFGRGCAGARVA